MIYGKRPVQEAERGRRRVHRVWRAPETSAEELERLCGSPDHQGVVAEVDPYPYADRNALLRREGALIVALDQVQDPRNLGAVCRSAELAGAAGRRHPRTACGGGDRGRLQGLGRRRRASRDRPRPQSRRLARRGEGLGLLDLGRRRRRPSPPWDVDLGGPTILVLGGEGSGIRPRVASACDGLLALPAKGRIDSLNVSAAAAALLFEAVRQRS